LKLKEKNIPFLEDRVNGQSTSTTRWKKKTEELKSFHEFSSATTDEVPEKLSL
jgi:hypothetical protein